MSNCKHVVSGREVTCDSMKKSWSSYCHDCPMLPDTQLLDVAQQHLLGADFAWGEPETSVVVLGPIPFGVRVGNDIRDILRKLAAYAKKVAA